MRRPRTAFHGQQLGVVRLIERRKLKHVVVVDVAGIQRQDGVVGTPEAARKDRMTQRAADEVESVGGLLGEVEGRVGDVGIGTETDDVTFVLDRFQLDLLLFDHVGRVQENWEEEERGI